MPLGTVSGRPRTAPHALAEENARLVHAVLVRRFPFLRSDPERREAAFTFGYLELLGACERFDPKAGASLSTYATRCIEGGILRFLQQERRETLVPTVSLETPVGEDGQLSDLIADPQAEAPGEQLLGRVGFESLIGGLGARHQALLRALYWEERAASEVAAAWGISRQRLAQIEQQALSALRDQQEAAALRREKARRRAWFPTQ